MRKYGAWVVILPLIMLFSTAGCSQDQNFDSCGYELPGGYMLYTDAFPTQSWGDPHIVMPMKGWESRYGPGLKAVVFYVDQIDWNSKYIATFSRKDIGKYKEYYDEETYAYNIIDVDAEAFIFQNDNPKEFQEESEKYFEGGVNMKYVQEQAERAAEE